MLSVAAAPSIRDDITSLSTSEIDAFFTNTTLMGESNVARFAFANIIRKGPPTNFRLLQASGEQFYALPFSVLCMGALHGFCWANIVLFTGIGSSFGQSAHIMFELAFIVAGIVSVFFMEHMALVIGTGFSGGFFVSIGADLFACTGYVEIVQRCITAATPSANDIPSASWGMVAAFVVLGIGGGCKLIIHLRSASAQCSSSSMVQDAASKSQRSPGACAAWILALQALVVFQVVDNKKFATEMDTAEASGSIHLVGSELRRFDFTYPLRLMSPGKAASHRNVFMLSHGGGFVSGDRVNLRVALSGPESSLTLLTQGSTKVYKTKKEDHDREHTEERRSSTSTWSQSSIHGVVTEGGLLCVLPEPVVPFAAARFRSQQTYALSVDGADRKASSSLVVLDWLVAGRVARGEAWAFDAYESRLSIIDAGSGQELLRDAWRFLAEDVAGVGGTPPLAFECIGVLMLLGERVAEWARAAESAYESVALGTGAHLGTVAGRGSTSDGSFSANELVWSVTRISRALSRSGDGESVGTRHSLDGVVVRFCAANSIVARQFICSRLRGLPAAELFVHSQ
ncbi:hypothetical protein HDU82_008839 [Entophlyctis luteolus]|nr:hypothetical protein HDU82_008839 [Entophlyctis luteolus]